MKGDYENMTVMVGMIAFTAAIIALIGFAQTSLIKFSADMKVSERDIQAIDAAHMVKDCLSQGDSIPLASLKKFSGSVCSCQKMSCYYDIGAEVTLLEGSKETVNFGYNEKDASTHKIFVTVSDGQKNHVARLYVSLKQAIL